MPPKPQVLMIAVLLCGCGSTTTYDPAEDNGAVSAQESATDACGERSCPENLLCGENKIFCEGGLGIRPCIDGQCGPSPRFCMAPFDDERTCGEMCGGAGFECVANGCEGATAFGYKAPAEVVGDFCGTRQNMTPLMLACDDPVPFDEYGAFQCCCDDPNE